MEKKITLKAMRSDSRYVNAIVLKGNNKLRDYDDTEKGISYRYAQFSTRALLDCPYKSIGCAIVCYATKGQHNAPSVKDNRERAKKATLKESFADDMIYTLETEFKSLRYMGNHMILRLHESGDFYSLEYLKKWIKVIEYFMSRNDFTICFYTKSFTFFNALEECEKEILRKAMERNIVAMSASLDDTTNANQLKEYFLLKKNFPLCNTYACTEDINTIQHDNVCDCADCAKCGHCTKSQGKTNVVKIHSASEKEMNNYRKHSKKTA